MVFWVCLARERHRKRKREMAAAPLSAVNPCYFQASWGERGREVSPDMISHCFCFFNVFSLFIFLKFCLCDMARYTWRDLNGLHVTGRGLCWDSFSIFDLQGKDLVSPFLLCLMYGRQTPTSKLKVNF